MKNLKKYKNGIIYNIITVNGSQPRPVKRQRKAQPQQQKYNPQIRGIQYLAPPPPSYADYGMSRFNTGNPQNNNVQDQYLREKFQALENRFNENNNLPMIEDLQEKINDLYDEQYNQKEYNNIAGRYFMNLENSINDRFDRIKAPYSFEDSAGSFAETGGDSSFVPQIGNDRQDILDYQNDEKDDEDETQTTPLIIDKRRNFTKPRNYEQLQISNEPFFNSQLENEEEKKDNIEFGNVYPTNENFTFSNDKIPTEVNEHQEQPPPPEIQNTPPMDEDVYTDYNTLIQRYIDLGGVDESIIESYNSKVVQEAINKLKKQKEEEKQLTAEDIKFRPSESQEVIKPLFQDIDEDKTIKDTQKPIVKDVDDNEDDDEEQDVVKTVEPKKKVGRPTKEEEINKKESLIQKYKDLGGTFNFSIYDSITFIQKKIKDLERDKQARLKSIINDYQFYGGSDDMSNNNYEEIFDKTLQLMKNKYRDLGGNDTKVLNAKTKDIVEKGINKMNEEINENLKFHIAQYKNRGGSNKEILKSKNVDIIRAATLKLPEIKTAYKRPYNKKK